MCCNDQDRKDLKKFQEDLIDYAAKRSTVTGELHAAFPYDSDRI